MSRTIEFLRDRYVPDGTPCEADMALPDALVQCGAAAVLLTRVDGKEHYVCHHHLTALCKEKWPVQPPGKRNR